MCGKLHSQRKCPAAKINLPNPPALKHLMRENTCMGRNIKLCLAWLVLSYRASRELPSAATTKGQNPAKLTGMQTTSRKMWC